MLDAILFFSVLLLSARLLEELMLRLKQSQVLGDILAGIIVGPALLHIVSPIVEINFLVNLGLYFFFFIIGFQEIDLVSLRRVLRKRLLPAALLAFVVPLLVCYVFLSFTGFSVETAILVAGVMGISSLGIATRILMDLGMLKKPQGLEVFGFVAIVEFTGLLFVTVLLQSYALATEITLQSLFGLTLKLLAFVLVVALVSFAAGPKILEFVRRRLRTREASFGIIAGLLLLVVWFSELMGVHGAVGALILGLGLSGSSKSPEHVEAIQGFRSIAHGVFIPVFFAGTGLYFSFAFLSTPLTFLLLFIVVIMVSKLVGAYAGARIARSSSPSLVSVGSLSKGGLELGLLLSMLETGLLSSQVFSIVLIVIFGALLIAPMLFRAVAKKQKLQATPSVEESVIPLYCRYAYRTLLVKDVMSSAKARIHSNLSVAQFFRHHVKLGYRSYFVVDAKDRLVGVFVVTDLGSIPASKHKSVRIGDVMRRKFPVLLPETPVDVAVETLLREGVNRLPVVSPTNSRKVLGTFDKGDAIKSIFFGDKKGPDRADETEKRPA
jgi:Kef-type K+ transport system membrane component KefB/predicted transcriptional regulator